MKKLLALLIMMSSIAWAQAPEDDNDMISPFPGGGRIIEKLNLTADQQKQFDKLQSDIQKKQIDLHSKIQTLRIDVRDLFRYEKSDQGKIETKISEISKLQNEMKLNHVGFWFDINKILTPEQQKIWKEHRMMMGPHFGKGMRGDGFRHPRGQRMRKFIEKRFENKIEKED